MEQEERKLKKEKRLKKQLEKLQKREKLFNKIFQITKWRTKFPV